MEKAAKKTEKKPLGVVESLSNGFDLILQNPWILLVPIALDFFLWLGPQINVKPIFQQTLTLLLAAVPPDAPAETMQSIETLQGLLQTAGDSMNLFGVLATGMPTVIGVEPPTTNVPRTLFVVNDGILLLGLLALLGLGGVLLMSAYLELMAQPVRKQTGMSPLIARWFSSFLNLILLALLIGVALMTLMIPVSLVAGVFSLASQELGSFVLLGGLLLIFWALLYLAFAIPAIFVSRANAPQALLNSIRVFRFNFWSAIGLIFIVYLVRTGFAIVWQFFDNNTWGVVFSVIANAFLSSGLLAAEMLFYNDRMNWLAAVRAQLQQQKKA
jgi:hypothetical protein